MPGFPPALAASPSSWSRISAETPPWTRPGGPSYAAPRRKSDHARPLSSCLTTSGGATGLRRPTTALPQARPWPAALNRTPYDPSIWRSRSRLVIASISAWAMPDVVVVDLGADHRIGELAHALGQRPVEVRCRAISSAGTSSNT